MPAFALGMRILIIWILVSIFGKNHDVRIWDVIVVIFQRYWLWHQAQVFDLFILAADGGHLVCVRGSKPAACNHPFHWWHIRTSCPGRPACSSFFFLSTPWLISLTAREWQRRDTAGVRFEHIFALGITDLTDYFTGDVLHIKYELLFYFTSQYNLSVVTNVSQATLLFGVQMPK